MPPPPGAFDVDMIEAINLLEGHEGRGINPLEALLGTRLFNRKRVINYFIALILGGEFPPLIDIPPDADDETIVELAIALSLQVKLTNVLWRNKV